MPASYRFRTLDRFDALRAAAPSLDGGPREDLFLTLAWFENLARNGFDADGPIRLELAVADDPASPAICLPLASSADGRRLLSLSNYYSSLFGPVNSGAPSEAALWRSLIRHLKAGSPWHTLNISPLDADSPFFSDFLQAARLEGCWADSYLCFGNWYLDVGGRSFDAYFDALPPQLKNNVVRGRKRLNKAGAWRIDVQVQPDARLDQAIEDFEAVYARSWKGRESHPFFVGSLCRTAAAEGWLRLGVLRLDGRPIAAQLWLTHAGKASIYKLAYDSAYARLSAGTVLSAAMMKQAIDADRVRQVDYLTGDDAYKKDWMSHRRERLGIIVFNPAHVRGVLAAGRHFLPKWVKTALRSR